MRTIKFGNKDSYSYYKLLTLSIDIPEAMPKITKIDIPGRDGDLDVSTAIAGHIIYENREVTLRFRAVSDDVKTCKEKRDAFVKACHGKTVSFYVSDEDQNFFYRGRATVQTVEDKGYYVDIEVNIDTEPFKSGVVHQEISDIMRLGEFVEKSIDYEGDDYAQFTIKTNNDCQIKYGDVIYSKSKGSSTAPFTLKPNATTTFYIKVESPTSLELRYEVRKLV